MPLSFLTAPNAPLTCLRQLLGAVALLSLPACGLGEVDGNGERSNENRAAPHFARVKSDADVDVKITQGDQFEVVVSIDENLQELVTTRLEGDILVIDAREDIGDRVAGPHVLISVPELHAAKLTGSGSMRAELDQPERPFDLFLDGSGVMSFRGHAAAVGAYLSGSGDIRLEGETSDVDIELSGSGSVRGKGMVAESGRIELSGSGDVSATVESSVVVSLSGSGLIDLYGGASLDSYTNSGSGDVNQH